MRMKCASVVMLLACVVPTVRGQIPAPAAIPVAPVVAVPVAAAPTGCLANLLACSAICKQQFCASTLGRFLSNGLLPLGAMTGGMVGSCCPLVPAAALLAPADSVTGAAARIKLDEADAKLRRENVRYLGSVDCRYWPEAKDALINALRADRNECVRLEAAYQLGRGCCCNRATTQALLLSATGGIDDGNPSEPSERVRATAFMALNSCLSRMMPEVVVLEKEVIPIVPEKLPDPRGEKIGAGQSENNATAAKSAGDSGSYYQRIERMPVQEFVTSAYKALDKIQHAVPVGSPVTPPRPSGGSLFEIVRGATPAAPAPNTTTPTVTATQVPQQPAPRLEPVAVTTPNVQKPVVNPGIANHLTAVPDRTDWVGPVTTPDNGTSVVTPPRQVAPPVPAPATERGGPAGSGCGPATIDTTPVGQRNTGILPPPVAAPVAPLPSGNLPQQLPTDSVVPAPATERSGPAGSGCGPATIDATIVGQQNSVIVPPPVASLPSGNLPQQLPTDPVVPASATERSGPAGSGSSPAAIDTTTVGQRNTGIVPGGYGYGRALIDTTNLGQQNTVIVPPAVPAPVAPLANGNVRQQLPTDPAAPASITAHGGPGGYGCDPATIDTSSMGQQSPVVVPPSISAHGGPGGYGCGPATIDTSSMGQQSPVVVPPSVSAHGGPGGYGCGPATIDTTSMGQQSPVVVPPSISAHGGPGGYGCGPATINTSSMGQQSPVVVPPSISAHGGLGGYGCGPATIDTSNMGQQNRVVAPPSSTERGGPGGYGCGPATIDTSSMGQQNTAVVPVAATAPVASLPNRLLSQQLVTDPVGVQTPLTAPVAIPAPPTPGDQATPDSGRAALGAPMSQEPE